MPVSSAKTPGRSAKLKQLPNVKRAKNCKTTADQFNNLTLAFSRITLLKTVDNSIFANKLSPVISLPLIAIYIYPDKKILRIYVRKSV